MISSLTNTQFIKNTDLIRGGEVVKFYTVDGAEIDDGIYSDSGMTTLCTQFNLKNGIPESTIYTSCYSPVLAIVTRGDVIVSSGTYMLMSEQNLVVVRSTTPPAAGTPSNVVTMVV